MLRHDDAVKFMSEVARLHSDGHDEEETAMLLHMSVPELRDRIFEATDAVHEHKEKEARDLRDKGYSFSAIAKAMNIKEEYNGHTI